MNPMIEQIMMWFTIFVLFVAGYFCLFKTEAMQRWVINYYERHPFQAKFVFMSYVKSRRYIIYQRIGGFMCWVVAVLLAWILFDLKLGWI